MKRVMIGVVAGWLLSSWAPVPPPVQRGLKTVASRIKEFASAKLDEYRVRQRLLAQAHSLVGPSHP